MNNKIRASYIESIIFRRTKNSIKYLLLKRSDYTKYYPGIWQIVTGTVEKNESYYQTALRESIEETHIKIKNLYAFTKLNAFYSPMKDTINLVPVFAIETDDDYVKLSEEHTEYKWLSIIKAVELVYFYTQKEMLKIINLNLKNKSLYNNLIKIEL